MLLDSPVEIPDGHVAGVFLRINEEGWRSVDLKLLVSSIPNPLDPAQYLLIGKAGFETFLQVQEPYPTPVPHPAALPTPHHGPPA